MAYYWTCPYCHCNLDPGEKCDCQNVRSQKERAAAEMIADDPVTGQMFINLDMIRGRGRRKLA